jgi:hypothetical protein
MKRILFISLFLHIVLTGSAQNFVKMNECVISNGQLKQITADYDPATGEKSVMVNGVRKKMTEVYPKSGPGYAAGQEWFINAEAIKFKGDSYVKYGLPRILGLTEIEKAGDYKGVSVFTEAGIKGKIEVIYLPVRQGCEFQPYQFSCGSAKIEYISADSTTMQLKAIPEGMTGKIVYTWSSKTVKVIKGQGTANVTIQYAGLKPDDAFSVELKLVDPRNCPVTKYGRFAVPLKREMKN